MRFPVLLLLCGLPAVFGQKLGYHDVKTDSSGAITVWYGNTPAEAFDHDVRLLWDFWRNMRTCPNGVPYYLQHQVWKPDQDDPRGLGGDQISMALSSWELLHEYLGDPAIIDNMRHMADYWLAHGLSPADALYPNVPFPYNLDVHSGEYDGDMRAGRGFLQPDKAGSFGAELVTLYKITGERKYLDAAVGIADGLAKTAKSGDGDNSPWPFRVNAFTGEVHEQKNKAGKTLRASYTSNWTGALRLFAGLIAMPDAKGDRDGWKRARQITLTWIKQYPLKTNKWGPFFEDIPTADWSDTEINADTLAWYILEQQSAWDANWKQQTKSALDWSFGRLANHEFEQWKVTAVNEQTAYLVPGNSHTSRHASVELIYCQATGECADRTAAVRRLIWATYMVDSDGKNRYPRDDIWLTDGYGDYVRHYLRAMAADPALAPDDQNHLLASTSVIQKIAYGGDEITYSKFDARSRERLKLGAWIPGALSGGTMKWDAQSHVLTVDSTEKSVTIRRKR